MNLSRRAGIAAATVLMVAVVGLLVLAFTGDGFFSGGRTVSCESHVEGTSCEEG